MPKEGMGSLELSYRKLGAKLAKVGAMNQTLGHSKNRICC